MREKIDRQGYPSPLPPPTRGGEFLVRTFFISGFGMQLSIDVKTKKCYKELVMAGRGYSAGNHPFGSIHPLPLQVMRNY